MVTALTLRKGQTVWFVPADRRARGNGQAWTITGVGRVWAVAGAHRIAKNPNAHGVYVVDGAGFSSPGVCFLSEREATDRAARIAAWGGFLARVRYTDPPAAVSVEAIRAFASLWGLALDDKVDPTVR